MGKCNRCNVYIKDETEYCPLCHGGLEADDDVMNFYPSLVRKNRVMSFMFRLMLFIWIAVSVLCCFLNYYLTPDFFWSLIVIIGGAYCIWVLHMFAKEDMGYRKRTLLSMFFGVILAIVIDMLLGFRGWSLNFVLPGSFVALDIGLIILIIVNNRNWQSYMIIEIGICVFALIPVILCLLHIERYPFIGFGTFAVSVLTFLGTLIIGGNPAREELRRRFHVR